jgi:hypothetical protein
MISRRRIRRLAFAPAFMAALGFALWTAPRWLVPRVVAFTFVDGPDSGHTDEILRQANPIVMLARLRQTDTAAS